MTSNHCLAASSSHNIYQCEMGCVEILKSAPPSVSGGRRRLILCLPLWAPESSEGPGVIEALKTLQYATNRDKISHLHARCSNEGIVGAEGPVYVRVSLRCLGPNDGRVVVATLGDRLNVFS